MSNRLNVVTGATGLLGIPLVRQLVERGERMRTIVRASSDTTVLKKLGVQIVVEDLRESAGLRFAVTGADIVYHCAARVVDYGPWRLFQEEIIDTTRHVLEACLSVGVGRVLHVSSSRVYGRPRGPHALTEDEPLGQRLWRLWDYYPRAKIAAEKLCREYPGAWTIVRPTWVYGLHDRNTLPRIIRTLCVGQAAIIGSGQNPLNIVFADDASEGMIRAANHPASVGQVYNLGATEKFTQLQLLTAVTEALGRPPLTRRVPYWLAFRFGFLVELVGKTLRVKRPLRVTRHGVSLMGTTLNISSDKAREQLGWVQKMPPLEGLQRTLEWYFSEGGGKAFLSGEKPKGWVRRTLGNIFGRRKG